MQATDTFNAAMGVTLPGDVLRAAQYDLMLKQLSVALDPAGSNLSYQKREQVFDALDWYNVDHLHAGKDGAGHPVFRSPPAGQWIAADMRQADAKEKFRQLESIGWLKLEPYAGED